MKKSNKFSPEVRVRAVRMAQKPLGRSDVSTTKIYTHVLNRGGRGVQNPLDQI